MYCFLINHKTKALSLSLHHMFIIHISDKGIEQLYCIKHFSAETNKHHTHTFHLWTTSSKQTTINQVQHMVINREKRMHSKFASLHLEIWMFPAPFLLNKNRWILTFQNNFTEGVFLYFYIKYFSKRYGLAFCRPSNAQIPLRSNRRIAHFLLRGIFICT